MLYARGINNEQSNMGEEERSGKSSVSAVIVLNRDNSNGVIALLLH